MNIDNEPGRWRCKNQKAPLLGEIKITGGGTAGNWCTFRKERNYCRKLFLVPEKFVLLQRHLKHLLRLREICFQKKVERVSVWVGRCDKKGDISESYCPAGEYPESIWEHLGASGGIWRHWADWSVFNRLLRDAHENKYFKHPLNAHQPHPQKNMMGWDIQAYLKLMALVSQELNF